MYQKQKKFKEAINDYSKSIQLIPNGTAYYNRGLCYFNINNSNKGCEDMKLAIKWGVEQAKEYLEKNCK